MNSNKDLSDAAAGLPSTSSTANIMANVSNLTRTRSLRLGNSNTRTNGLFNECYPGGAGLARSGSFRSSHRPSLAQLPSNTSSIGGNHLLVSPSKHRESLMSRSTYSEADRVIELDIEGKTHRINVNRHLNSLLEDRNSKFNAMIEKSKSCLSDIIIMTHNDMHSLRDSCFRDTNSFLYFYFFLLLFQSTFISSYCLFVKCPLLTPALLLFPLK